MQHRLPRYLERGIGMANAEDGARREAEVALLSPCVDGEGAERRLSELLVTFQRLSLASIV